MRRAGVVAAVAAALLLAGGGARAAEQGVGVGVIRDVRPTTLEAGDRLVIECDGLVPGAPARVILRGTFSAAGQSPARRTLLLSGRTAAGGRAIVDADAALQRELGGHTRVTDAMLEVVQVGGGLAIWRTAAGYPLALDLFPRTFRSLAGDVAARAAPAGLRPGVVAGAMIVALALGLLLLIAPLTGLVVVWERKISGRMQSRFGPNRVGPRGWLQWLADGIKLIIKEDLVPRDADPTLFRLSPYLMWMGVFATLVVLPLSQLAIVADMNIGLLYLSSVTALTVVGVIMGGWASNSKWSLLGGMRSAAQIVSYELPASLALLQIAVLAGTLSPQAIVAAQGGLPHQWFVFRSPFTFAAFFIYFIAALAEGNRTPFDLPEAESELVAGYNTEYSGFRYSIFSLAEWTNLYVIGAVASAMFLGGWNVPGVAPAAIEGSALLQAASAAVMAVKILAVVFVVIWIRWTLPRFRVDQMMNLCWKVLIPIAFGGFLGATLWTWATARWPVADLAVRWAMFLVGGVALGAFFVWRVVWNFRHTRLLHVGDRQFTLPFTERHLEKR